ncbi:hypothetical protein KCP77_22135 [Salmonella enterica subsp. enterica]|nr:hypothetical protein KCP77_22135 [Salmonella enterica subsp. enterica]
MARICRPTGATRVADFKLVVTVCAPDGAGHARPPSRFSLISPDVPAAPQPAAGTLTLLPVFAARTCHPRSVDGRKWPPGVVEMRWRDA